MTFWILCGAAVFSAALGMALICCGRRQFGACTSETQGVVVDIYRNANFEGDSYAPVVEFHAGGQTVRGKARTEKTGGRSRVPFEVGDRVNLRYNSDNPRQFLIQGYDQNIIVWVGASGFAAAAVLAAAAFLFR